MAKDDTAEATRTLLRDTVEKFIQREQFTEQLIKDAAEIRSSYGYLLMRLAVAASAEDAYQVAKKEFFDHEAALKRLEVLPTYGSAVWLALASSKSADAVDPSVGIQES